MRLTTIALIGFLVAIPIEVFAIETCQAGKRFTCVVDGDTIWLEGEKIRIMHYDTPETTTNVCGGEAEVSLGKRASARLVDLLNGGGISIERHGVDRYGRTLAIVRVYGRNVGDILVSEGLARHWPDGHEFWCG